MIYKTLHWYVLRELLRTFLATAAVLTTLLAFGGTFKPLTKEGLDVVVLLKIMTNLMPAMLAYTIPVAALFGAVQVYWRLSTDNELTACRASGVSFWSMLAPALLLGVAVASVDLVFVNFVVPAFLQRTERAMRQDIGALLVAKIGRGEPFVDPGKNLVVDADSARVLPAENPNVTKIELRGMTVARLNKKGEFTATGSAMRAVVVLTNVPERDETQVSVEALEDASGYDFWSFRRMSGSLSSLLPSQKPFVIPPQFRDKPKFSNVFQLKKIDMQPWRYGAVHDLLEKTRLVMKHQIVAQRLAGKFDESKGGRATGRLEFAQGPAERAVVTAGMVELSPALNLRFAGGEGGRARVEIFSGGSVIRVYTAEAVELLLEPDEVGGVIGSLTLHGKDIMMENLRQRLAPVRIGGDRADASGVAAKEKVDPIPGIGLLPPELGVVQDSEEPADDAGRTVFWEKVRRAAGESRSPALAELAGSTRVEMERLDRTISSELHSRGSFAVSCLTLVLFGAALGVMLRGRNPLGVFVVGFVPSIVLVLLITAGRRVMEEQHTSLTMGLSLLWAGNVILLALVVGVYSKLLRT